VKLTDIVEYCFNRNGQYIVGGLESINSDLARFWTVISQEFYEYERFFPLTKQINIATNRSLTGIYYDFTHDTNNVGYDASDPDSIVFGEPPIKITQAVPITTMNVLGTFSMWSQYSPMLGVIGGNPGTRIPANRMGIYKYLRPVLYVRESGRYDVHCNYRYQAIETLSSDTTPVLTEVELIMHDKEMKLFLDLCSARFLETVGRVRRAFTQDDLQITTDAKELVEEGMKMYEDARTQMYNRQEWYKAQRP
jgi:hypothetical protein